MSTQQHNYFFDQLEAGKASITDVVAKPLPEAQDIKRLLDQVVEYFGKGKDYRKTQQAFSLGSLYGKNGDLKHLLKCLGEVYKFDVDVEKLAIVDMLIKNVLNTTDCINQFSTVKSEIFMSMILGYAFSILHEKGNIS